MQVGSLHHKEKVMHPLDVIIGVIWFIGLWELTGRFMSAVYYWLFTAAFIMAFTEPSIAIRLVVFTLGVGLGHLGIFILLAVKRYERNLRMIPTCSKSAGFEALEEVAREKRLPYTLQYVVLIGRIDNNTTTLQKRPTCWALFY